LIRIFVDSKIDFGMMQSDAPPPHNRLFIWLPFLLSIVLAGGILLGMRLQSAAPPLLITGENLVGGKEFSAYGKIEELLRYIEAKYVDEVDRGKLVDKAIQSILQELDPHSGFIPADQLDVVEESMEGSFSGIGVEFIMLEDTVVVVAPLSGGPAEKAGLLAGDKIIAVEDSVIAGRGLLNRDIIKLLRGKTGEKVTITVLRTTGKTLKVTLTRDKIPMHSLDAAFMLDAKTGYIKLNRFSATTHDEFMKALEMLSTQHKVQNLVLDLRQNPGGYLQQAVNILCQLFPTKGLPLLYTEGRAVNRSDYESTGRVLFPLKDIVVLIDEGSASASEIVAGALQDQDRGTIVGRRSFGKGLVQEQYELHDGSALRLTVARYYIPSGRSIQKPYENPLAYAHDTEERLENGELSSDKPRSPLDSTTYLTSKGRKVFGGGGITPDYIIPLDTTLLNTNLIKIRPWLQPFAFNYVRNDSTTFSGMSLQRYQQEFQVKESLLQEFVAYTAEKTDIKKDPKALAPILPELKRQLKSQIARVLFKEEGYFTVTSSNDPAVQKALRVIAENRSDKK
jgi:carboxyl-terminal processing protease